MLQAGIDGAERTPGGDQVGEHGQAQEPISIRRPQDNNSIGQFLQQAHGGLDQPLPPDLEQALVPAHPGALASCQDKARDGNRGEHVFRSAPLLFHCRLPLLAPEVLKRSNNAVKASLPVPLIFTHGARCLPPTGSTAGWALVSQKPSRQAKADAVGGGSRGRQTAAHGQGRSLQHRPDLLKSFGRHSPLTVGLK